MLYNLSHDLDTAELSPLLEMHGAIHAQATCTLFLILHSCRDGRKEMFYLTTHSTHFIYGYMASNIWLRTILIARKETYCHHIGYSFRLAARVLLYAPSHRQDSIYHSLCYTSRGALVGTRNRLNIKLCDAGTSRTMALVPA